MDGVAMDGMAVAVGLCAATCIWTAGGASRAEMREMLDGWLDAVLRLRGAVNRGMGALMHSLEPVQPETTLGEVAEMVDMVRLGLTAGLSFDAALDLYCEHRSSGLATELAHARMRWRAGAATRGDALHEVAAALEVRSLESFAVAVEEAMELGAPLADALEAQGRECRRAHRARVERAIERAPVKILIPTGTLILPALLLSIMGPLMAAGGMI